MARHDVKDAGDPRATTEAVAGFYEQLVFPSRGSHPEYQALLPQAPGERVADFGCGQSIFHDALRGYEPPAVFLDRSASALQTIEHGGRVRADLRALPFPSRTFDRIFCIGVLHHLPERDAVLREVARVLRPGGKFVLGVYAPGSLQARLRGAYDASAGRPWRPLVFQLTRALVALRYARSGVGGTDVDLRTRDFLDVPYVQYSPPELYEGEAARAGLRAAGRRRIAAMNVLELVRDSS